MAQAAEEAGGQACVSRKKRSRRLETHVTSSSMSAKGGRFVPGLLVHGNAKPNWILTSQRTRQVGGRSICGMGGMHKAVTTNQRRTLGKEMQRLVEQIRAG